MVQFKKSYRVLGLMSGTSLDGIDFCLVDFTFDKEQPTFKIVATETIHYSSFWKDRLDRADQLSAADLIAVDREYGSFLGHLSQQFLKQHNCQADLIASHGHTVFHQPAKAFTLQIGHGGNLAVTAKTHVVCDFRSSDVALGGQGAPLVPFGDLHLFKENQACLNIGGIANISVKKDGKIIAYDIAPANMVLNYLSKKYFNQEFDKDGNISRKGKINHTLFNSLENWEYYKKSFPKSLGKEDVFDDIIPLIEESNVSPEDKLHTFSQHLANRLINDFNSHNLKDKVLITGGGAHNLYLMDLLSQKHEIELPSKEIIEFKEALLFAFLGVNRWLEKNNVLASVTAAPHDHSAGAIYLP